MREQLSRAASFSSYDVSKDARRSPREGASIVPSDEPTVDRASMTFRHGLAVTTAIQAAALLAAAVFVLLASRWLGSEGKGTQAILVSGGQLLALVLSFGLGSSMPYIVSSDIRLAGLMALRQGQLLVGAAIALSAAAFFNRSIVLFPSLVGLEGVLVAFTISTIAQTSYSSLALASGRLWTFNLAALLSAFVSLAILGFLQLIGGITPESVVWAQALGLAAGVGYVLLDLWVHGLLRVVRTAVNVRGHVRASVLGYATALLTFLMFRVDIFLVAALAGGLGAVGIYSVATAIAELFLRVPHWAGYLLMPIVARRGRDAGHQTVRLFWVSVGFAILLFVLAIAFGGWLDALVVAVVGMEFSPVLVVLYTIFPRIVFQSGATILVSNLGGWGYTLYNPGSIAIGLVTVVGLDLALLPRLGLVGAGLASSTAALAMLVVIMVGFLRLNGLALRAFFPTVLQRRSPSEERPSAA
jgi:O-antigen/teichoic acid export membrane protein